MFAPATTLNRPICGYRRLAKLLPLGLLAMFIVLGPSQSGAQQGDLDTVIRFIEQTGRLIEQAREVVEETDSQRARQVLVQALQLHQNSVMRLEDGRPLVALRLSRGARKAAQQAVRLARESRGFEEQGRRRWERFMERRDRLAERAEEAGNERAQRFVRAAEKQAARAREQFSQNNFAMALQLLNAADGLLNRAARLLFEGGDIERLQQELERTGELITITAERLAAGPDPEAARLLDDAREALARAWSHLDRREPMAARSSGRMARDLASRAAALAGGEPAQALVEQQIARWDERYTAVAERVAESGSDPARETLERARGHRDRAVERLAGGRGEEALREIKTAHDLLHRADELAR